MEQEFKGKTILVTGVTGSIGSEIVKQLVRYQPKTIRVFARNEMGHYHLQRSLGNVPNIRFIVGDIRDKERLRLAMEGVDIVFHAAALKHVDICEDNPFEAVRTNILGTQNVIELARENNLEKVIAISTDKAANPESVLGVSKLMAEKLILNTYYYHGDKRTKFACVRFGNVLGSNGSVVPLFKTQIQEQGSITITDPAMTRFIMTIPQAVALVLKASSMMRGHEIFVLKMPAVNIEMLARCAIDVFSPQSRKSAHEIAINVIGSRVGDKKHEALLADHEVRHAWETQDMYILTPHETVWGQEFPTTYPDAKKVSQQSFSSEHAPQLTPAELRKLFDKDIVQYI